MNNQAIFGMGVNRSMEQLEEQVVRHQQQIRALHFEIAKCQMQQGSQSVAMNTDAIRNMQQATGFGQQLSEHGSEGSNFRQQFAQGTFGQQNALNTQDNSFQQPMSTNHGQTSSQNAFEKKKQNTFGHPSQSSMSFGQTNSFESNQNQHQASSFGHPSQSSFTPQTTPRQQSAAFQQATTASVQAAVLKPDGRMINKAGQFLGRVQAVPSEGCAVTIKRLGKPKFFDYKTVDECLRKWQHQ